MLFRSYDARLEQLKVIRNAAAEAHGLESSVLCTNTTLQTLARRENASREDLDSVDGLRRWQREVLGEQAILHILAGDRVQTHPEG